MTKVEEIKMMKMKHPPKRVPPSPSPRCPRDVVRWAWVAYEKAGR